MTRLPPPAANPGPRAYGESSMLLPKDYDSLIEAIRSSVVGLFGLIV